MSAVLWQQCQKYLQRELSSHDFNTWIRPLQAMEAENILRLLAPNRFVLNWVQQHYAARIEHILTHLKPNQTPQLILQVGSRASISPSSAQHTANLPKKNINGSQPAFKHNNRLNTKLTFDSFVAGECNQLARAAALHVTEQEGYNPLFIYGGVGLGKTHLMHAVGNQIVAQNPQAKVAYVRSEQFVNEMVKALREKNINEFKKYYRSLDALLIDDVQFFANKTQSQEELFHTFNALLENQKKIILTCDRIPQQINGLEDRLKSRFAWGLTVAIEPPDLDTRLEILKLKAHLAKINLPNEVNYFIAQHIYSNVRELEGALHRLIATARLMKKTITVENAREALKDLVALKKTLVSLTKIQQTVADYFKISVGEMKSRKRLRKIVRPRQIAMTLSKELTEHSLPEIGDAFGGRDHTTVMYSCRSVSKLQQEDQQIKNDYVKLLKLLS